MIQDHVRVFMSGRVESMEDFAGIMSSLSAPSLQQILRMISVVHAFEFDVMFVVLLGFCYCLFVMYSY